MKMSPAMKRHIAAKRKKLQKRYENVEFMVSTEARGRLATLTDVLKKRAADDPSNAWTRIGGSPDKPQLVIEAASVWDLPASGITITIQEARARWPDVLDAALHHGRDIWLTRRGVQVLVIYRDPDAVLPCQDLLDRDDRGREDNDASGGRDDTGGGGSIAEQIATLSKKMDAIAERLDKGLRSMSLAMDTTIGPVRRLLIAEARKRAGLHPTVAVH